MDRQHPHEVIRRYPAHDETLHGLFDSRAVVNRNRPCLLFADRVRSWEQVALESHNAAHLLARLGVSKGSRVAIMARNSDRYVVLFLAIARLGAILVPVNPDYGLEEAGYVLTHSGADVVFHDSTAMSVAVKAASTMHPRPCLIHIDADSEERNAYSRLLEHPGPRDELKVPVGPNDTALILYTSGTTGFPKGVMHSHRNIVLAGESFLHRMHLQADDRLLTVLPLFHINALIYSLCGTIAAGASIVLTNKFSASRFWHLAAETQATEVNIIAAVGRILAKRPRCEYKPSHCIRKVYGAPIPSDVIPVFRDEFGIEVLIEGYGLTEAPGITSNPFLGPHKPGSIGISSGHPASKEPLAQIRVLGPNGEDLPDREVGQLVVRTPLLMQGYFRDPEGTRAAFKGDWFLTGDLGYRSPDGFFTFVARAKDIIRRRGENISGAEIDRTLCMHPEISEAAAVPVDSDLGEDEIMAVVVPRPGARLSAEQVHAWCAEQLSPWKAPRYVVFAENLPYTSSHRVAKYQLRSDASLRSRAIEVKGAEIMQK